MLDFEIVEQDYQRLIGFLENEREALLKLDDQRLASLRPLIERYSARVTKLTNHVSRLQGDQKEQLLELVTELQKSVEHNQKAWHKLRGELVEEKSKLHSARRLAEGLRPKESGSSGLLDQTG